MQEHMRSPTSSTNGSMHSHWPDPSISPAPSGASPHGSSSNGGIGIFWDYENVPIGRNQQPSAAANRLRDVLLPHGHIVERRMYYDSRKLRSDRDSDRCLLDQSGFTLVDCPTRNKKENLDKKLIVDVMQFAWQHHANGARCTVALIASDGDYSYALSKIRDLGMKTIVIVGPKMKTAHVLLDVCDCALTWVHDVLHSAPHEETAHYETAHFVQVVSDAEGEGSIIDGSIIDVDDDEQSIADAVTGRYLTLCHSLQELASRRGGWDEWVLDSNVERVFHRKRGGGVLETEEYHAITGSAVIGGFVQAGRRDQPGAAIEKIHTGAFVHLGKSIGEVYLRLTESGHELLFDVDEAADMATKRLTNSVSLAGHVLNPLDEEGDCGEASPFGLASPSPHGVPGPSDDHADQTLVEFTGKLTYTEKTGFYVANKDIYIAWSDFAETPKNRLPRGTRVTGKKIWNPMGQNNWKGLQVEIVDKPERFVGRITYVGKDCCIADGDIVIGHDSLNKESDRAALKEGAKVEGMKRHAPRGQNEWEACKASVKLCGDDADALSA